MPHEILEILHSEQLLAAFWLSDDHDISNTIETQLDTLIQKRAFHVSPDTYEPALRHLQKHEIGYWVVGLCHMGHPHDIWNFMIHAMRVSEDIHHLAKIANELGVHILAHYGSCMDKFEVVAKRNPLFARMATGIWRHRMSDDVWVRLRKIQAEVADPLPNMVPLHLGIDYWYGDKNSTDRQRPDKGIYMLKASGEWEKE